MGLDMYLIKRSYIGAIYDHNNVRGTLSITRRGHKLPIKLGRVRTIDEQVGYWRKAYFVDTWLSSHIPGGVKECRPHYVPIETIKALYEEISRRLHDNKNSLDSYELCEFKETRRILGSVLREHKKDVADGVSEASYYYEPSW